MWHVVCDKCNGTNTVWKILSAKYNKKKLIRHLQCDIYAILWRRCYTFKLTNELCHIKCGKCNVMHVMGPIQYDKYNITNAMQKCNIICVGVLSYQQMGLFCGRLG